nr:MAG TPA: hypothetical protein [Caudoviricetes sp.]
MIQNQSGGGSGDVVSVLTGSADRSGVIGYNARYDKLTEEHRILSISMTVSSHANTTSKNGLIAWVSKNVGSGLNGDATAVNSVGKYFEPKDDISLTIDYSAGTIRPSGYAFAAYSFNIVVYGPPIN